MKKFVTTLMALLLTVALAVGFTACKDEEVVSYNEVTEEEWKSALNLFSGDASKVTEEDLNLLVEMSINYEFDNMQYSYKMEWKLNYTSKMASFFFDIGDGEWDSSYIWQDSDGKLYRGFYTNEEGEKPLGKYEYTGDFSTVELFLDLLLEADYYVFLNAIDSYNAYSKFEYNESDKCYKLQNSNEYSDGEINDMNLYFSNEKLAKIEIITDSDVSYITTFKYGSTTVTIPDEVKNYQG